MLLIKSQRTVILPKLSSPTPPLREVESPVGQMKGCENTWCDNYFFIFIIFNHKVFVLSDELEGMLE